MTNMERFTQLVDSFDLPKPGAKPFDADLLALNYGGASRPLFNKRVTRRN